MKPCLGIRTGRCKPPIYPIARTSQPLQVMNDVRVCLCADSTPHGMQLDHHGMSTPLHQHIASPSSFMKLQTPDMDPGCWFEHDGPVLGVADIFADPV